MLAEVRKFRQGIMILDQRPSSLVGGVLDNAMINIMCRLNDRGGFEHLSHVLNLSPVQQRYARTRLRAGQTLTLDATSGQPVLMRAPLMVETLRDQCPAPEEELRKMHDHARKAGVVCPAVVVTQSVGQSGVESTVVASIWAELSSMLDEKMMADVVQAAYRQDWATARNRIRDWLLQHRRELNPLLETTVFAQIVQDMRLPDIEALVSEFLR